MKVQVSRPIYVTKYVTALGLTKVVGKEELTIAEEVDHVYQLMVKDSGCLMLNRDGLLPTVYARGCWDKVEQI